MTAGRASSVRSIWSSSVPLPRLSRRLPCARAGGSPIAFKTCEASSEPEVQAEPVEAQMSLIEASSSDSPSTPSKTKLALFGRRAVGMAGELRPGHAREDALRSSRSRRVARRASRARGNSSVGELQRRGQARRCTARSRCPRAPTALLAAALHLGQQRRAPPHVEHADAFGRVELVAREASRSTPRRLTSSSSAPPPCTASVWRRMPRGRRCSAISGSGWMVPTSLLASITLTRVVRSVIARVPARRARPCRNRSTADR